MIALLSCSMNLSGRTNQPLLSTGVLADSLETKDSINIAIDDLRKVNAKLIELKYEKEINIKLRDVVNKDSIIIEEYKIYNNSISNKARKYKRQRNVATLSGIGLFVLAIIALLK